MKILAVIPARIGSKTITKKNLRMLAGKLLVQYPIDLARSVKLIGRIIVSTDSEEIAAVARKCGAEVPFLRPANLSKDQTPTFPVIRHCVKFLKEKENYEADIMALLYPTCPLLEKDRVLEALEILINGKANSVVSVTEDRGRFWKYKKALKTYVPFYPKGNVNRQYYEPLWRENGAIYFSRREVVEKQNRLIDTSSVKLLVMKSEEVLDIDTEEDFINAEKRICHRQK